MAVAFTREEDAEAAASYLPERPVSPHRNLVTPAGLAALDAALAAATAAYGEAQASDDVRTNRSAMAAAARDLRYYRKRRANAELVDPVRQTGAVQFGSTVTFDRQDGRRQTFRIVGEDEADAARGSVSHVSPLARVLLGKRLGDTAMLANGEVEVVAIG